MGTDLTLIHKLKKIQETLKVPKTLRNDFGGFNYRSCESILEALKPLEKEYDVMLVMSDDIVMVGERYYIKATARLYDTEASDVAPIEATAYAREPQNKKGFDESQITGAASSYARKYALSALFLLDDVKDADTDEYQNGGKTAEKVTAVMADKLRAALKDVGVTEEQLLEKFLPAKQIEDFTEAQYAEASEMVRKQARILAKRGASSAA